jgi:uncharacterized protein YdaT
MRDARIQELLEAAKEIEENLTDDGYSAEEILFIATLLTQSVSRAMSGVDSLEDDDDEDGESEGEPPAEADSEEDTTYA